MVPELARRRLVIVAQLIDEQLARMLRHVLLLRNSRGEVKHDRQSSNRVSRVGVALARRGQSWHPQPARPRRQRTSILQEFA